MTENSVCSAQKPCLGLSSAPPAVRHSLRVLNSTLADFGQAKDLVKLPLYERKPFIVKTTLLNSEY